MPKKWDPKIEIIFKKDLTPEENQKAIEKIQDAIVDLAVNYYVKKSKGEKKNA